MKSEVVTVTLYAAHTADGLAKACRDHAENVFRPCTVGWFFACQLRCPGDRQWCAKIDATDWEAVMVEVGDANAD